MPGEIPHPDPSNIVTNHQQLITVDDIPKHNPLDVDGRAGDIPTFVYEEETAPKPVEDATQVVQTEANPDWDYTRSAREIFGNNFNGRRMIGRDSAIDGGVYYGTYGGEAIVVDSEKYPAEINELSAEVKSRAVGKDGNIDRGNVLDAVFDVVSEKMKYSQEGVDKILDEIAELTGTETLTDGTKIPLNEFIKDGVGVCRHQALTVGVLLEKLKSEGIIRGNISVDRSQRWSPNGDREGHAWVRYTNSAGEVIILDVAQKYIGTLEGSEVEKRGWDYLRPEEQRARAAKQVGHAISRQELRRLIDGDI